jgi:hypothetical protein
MADKKTYETRLNADGEEVTVAKAPPVAKATPDTPYTARRPAGTPPGRMRIEGGGFAPTPAELAAAKEARMAALSTPEETAARKYHADMAAKFAAEQGDPNPSPSHETVPKKQ